MAYIPRGGFALQVEPLVAARQEKTMFKEMLVAVIVAASFGFLSGCVAYEVPVSDGGGGRAYQRDRDHDGVRDRADRDRDGDGVRNTQDRRPNDPRRY
jgi:hypothetical protein